MWPNYNMRELSSEQHMLANATGRTEDFQLVSEPLVPGDIWKGRDNRTVIRSVPVPHTQQKTQTHTAHMVFGEGLYGWGIGNSARPIQFTMLADHRCLQASMCGLITRPPPFPGSIILSFFPGKEPGARSMPTCFNWDSFPLLTPPPFSACGDESHSH